MPRFKPPAVKPTIEGFSGFRPKQWVADLPELSALNLAGGTLKMRCTLDGWDAASLRSLFEEEAYAEAAPEAEIPVASLSDSELDALLEATSNADRPLYADNLNLVALGSAAFSQRTTFSQRDYPDSEARSRWMKEIHTFNVLIATVAPEAPAGFMQFNSSVQWPTAFGLQPESIKDWGEVPPTSVSLYLGGVWLRPSYRGRRWGAALVEAYWVVLSEELNVLAAQLERIAPAEGPTHLVQVWLSGEYWSQVGQRLGATVMAELQHRCQGWLAQAKRIRLEIGVSES